MFKKSIAIALFGTLCSASALADHNSKWGEGWAQMPNDIHNTRVETRGDNTTFRDFVRKGNGATSINRYTTDRRSAGKRMSQSRQRAMTHTRQRGGRR